MIFEWDDKKDRENQKRHGVSFQQARKAFFDPDRIIFSDTKHSTLVESRFFCLGACTDGILTVRYTMRNKKIRIFGAGFWRKGKKIYEKENHLH